MAKAILIDMSKCIGCKACQVACQQWKGLPAEDTSFTGSYQNPPDMSAASPTVVKFFELGDGSDVRFRFFGDRCRHCSATEKSFCMDACPLDAIERRDIGWVWINPDKCDPSLCGGPSGARPCELSCPWHIPKLQYTKNGTVHEVKAMKCDGCFDRWADTELRGESDPVNAQEGGRFNGTPFTLSNRPACVVACPTNALRANKLDKMLIKATKRKRYLRKHGFPQANVYRGSWGGLCIWILPEARENYPYDF